MTKGGIVQLYIINAMIQLELSPLTPFPPMPNSSLANLEAGWACHRSLGAEDDQM
jgi:hypothetical protein